MRRRDFITLAGGAAAWPLAARAQQPERTRRIAWLENAPADSPAARARAAAVNEELEKLGWAVGRNLTIDYRWGVTSFEMAQQFGAELLQLSPDVVLCVGSPGVKALQQATKTVPVVFLQVAERSIRALCRVCRIPGTGWAKQAEHLPAARKAPAFFCRSLSGSWGPE